jgi:hypothetical protein
MDLVKLRFKPDPRLSLFRQPPAQGGCVLSPLDPPAHFSLSRLRLIDAPVDPAETIPVMFGLFPLFFGRSQRGLVLSDKRVVLLRQPPQHPFGGV